MIETWRIVPIEPPEPTLSQLKARYENAVAWEANARTGLDNYRVTYVRALLAGEPGDRAALRARARGWRKRLRDLQRAEAALTGLVLRANPVPDDACEVDQS